MEKKGDFGGRNMVTIILVILAFVILLVFLFNVINNSKLDNEACHQSVIVRGTTPSIASSYVPLNCKTNKICITTKTFGGKCNDFENSQEVTYVRVKNTAQVEKAISESIVDCWTMMGEGKLSLFSQYLVNSYGIGDIYPSCVMCSRIAFDKGSFENSKINLKDINVENYMATHEFGDQGISYLQYIAGEGAAPITVSKDLNFPDISKTSGTTTPNSQTSAQTQTDAQPNFDIMSADEKKAWAEAQKNNPDIQTNEIGVLFMQISAPKGTETLANIAKTSLGLGAGAVGTLGFTNTAGALMKVGKYGVQLCKTPVSGIVCAAAAFGAIFFQQADVAANRNIAAGVCSDVSIGEQARDGCSAVRVVNYNEESISSYCLGIESSK